MAIDSFAQNGPGSGFGMTDIVELLASDGPTRGRVIATRDGGRWIYVLWLERAGYHGRTTTESAADIRKLGRRT